MCCYKEYKNFERFNNLVQLIIHRAIKLIETLPQDCLQCGPHGDVTGVQDEGAKDQADDRKSDDMDSEKDVDVTSVEVESKDNVEATENAAEKSGDADPELPGSAGVTTENDLKNRGSGDEKENQGGNTEKPCDQSNPGEEEEVWTLDEKDRLFNFVSKVFLMNFPLYMAYKHCVNASLEELSKQDTNALNNYCELTVSTLCVLLSAFEHCLTLEPPSILSYIACIIIFN